MSEDAGTEADDHVPVDGAEEEEPVTGAGEQEPDTESDGEGPGTWPTSMPQPGRHDPMLWVAIALLGFLVFLLIFANVPEMRASAGTTMASHDWQLQTYADATGVMVPALPDAAVTFDFPEAGIAGGRSGCSYYAVNYTTTDYSIALAEPVIAGLGCWDPKATEQERAYFVDLTNCTEFRVSDTSLKMFGKDARQLLVFVPLN
jgi:heat shock protein HslJ